MTSPVPDYAKLVEWLNNFADTLDNLIIDFAPQADKQRKSLRNKDDRPLPRWNTY